jgi:hypothetical protein
MGQKVYPLYLVIDTSKSMNKPEAGVRRIDLAHRIMTSLWELYAENPSIVSLLQVSVITFNTEAKTALKLSPITNLIDVPPFTAESNTHFKVAFDKIKEQIELDYERMATAFTFMRPAVLMITDGDPNDALEQRDFAFRRLVPIDKNTGSIDFKKSPLAPQVIMFGTAESHETTLAAYSTAENPGLPWFRAKPNIASKDQMAQIAQAIKNSIARSTRKQQLNSKQPWVWGPEENIEDIEDYLEMS